jgi:hypothetical protein
MDALHRDSESEFTGRCENYWDLSKDKTQKRKEGRKEW